MAVTLPDIEDVRQRAPDARQQGIVRQDTQSQTAALETAQRFTQDAIQLRDEDELAKARVNFALLKTEQDNAYDEDPEFGTIPERYSSQINNGISTIASNITDHRVREAFMQEAEVRAAEGAARINDIAREKAHSFERGRIVEDGEILRKQAISQGTDTGFLFNAYKQRLETAAQRGVITSEQAQTGIIAFREEVAKEKLTAMDAEDRLAVLKDTGATWLSHLDAGTIQRLKNDAKAEVRVKKSQTAAMEAIERGMDPEEANAWLFKKLGAGDVYSAARTEFNAMFSAKETARVTNNRDAANAIWEAMFPPEGSGLLLSEIRLQGLADDQGEPYWDQLTQPQKDAFMRAEEQRAAGTVRSQSDRGVVLNTNLLYQQFKTGVPGAGRKLFAYITENMDRFNSADWNTWSKVAATGAIGEEVKPLFSAIDEINVLTKGWSSERTMRVINHMNQQYYDYRDQFGQDPDPKTVNEMRKNAFNMYSSNSVFDLDDEFYLMDTDEQIEFLMDLPDEQAQAEFIQSNFYGQSRIDLLLRWMQASNPQAFSRARDAVTARGAPETYDNIRDEYLRLTNEGQ